MRRLWLVRSARSVPSSHSLFFSTNGNPFGSQRKTLMIPKSPSLHLQKNQRFLSFKKDAKRIDPDEKILNQESAEEILNVFQFELSNTSKNKLGDTSILSVMKSFAESGQILQGTRLLRYLHDLNYTPQQGAEALRQSGLFVDSSQRDALRKNAPVVKGITVEMGLKGTYRNDRTVWLYQIVELLGLKATENLLTEAMAGFNRKGKWEKAVELFHQIKNPSPKACDSLVQSYLFLDRLDDAKETLKTMREKRMTPSYRPFLHKAIHDGDSTKVLEIYNKIRGIEKDPLHYHEQETLLYSFGRDKNLEGALEVFKTMEPMEEHLITMINVCRQCEQPEKELEFWEARRKFIEQAEGGLTANQEVELVEVMAEVNKICMERFKQHPSYPILAEQRHMFTVAVQVSPSEPFLATVTAPHKQQAILKAARAALRILSPEERKVNGKKWNRDVKSQD